MQSHTSVQPQTDADIRDSMPPIGKDLPATYYGRLLYFVWEDEALRSNMLDKLPTLQDCQNMLLDRNYAYLQRTAAICHERRDGDYSQLRNMGVSTSSADRSFASDQPTLQFNTISSASMSATMRQWKSSERQSKVSWTKLIQRYANSSTAKLASRSGSHPQT